MAIYKVVINKKYFSGNRPMLGLNEYLSACARHPKNGGRIKRDGMNICALAIRTQLRRVKIQNPIILNYRFYEYDRKRDLGNLLAFTDKCFEDALQECGVIQNDGQKYVKGISSGEVIIDKANPRIEVEIMEIG